MVFEPLVFAQNASGLEEGSRAYNRGEYELASTLASNYLKSHPGSPSGRVLLARVFMAQEKYAPAFQELQRALRADPQNIDALYYLRQVSGALFNFQYQDLFALAPDSAQVHQLLAESYQLREMTDKAEEEYLAALKADPKSVEVLNALGDIKRFQTRYDEAIPYYLRAEELKPRDYDSSYGLGVCYLYRQEPKKAIEALHVAVSVSPQSAIGHLTLGDALLRDNRTAEATTELKTATVLEPKMRQAYTLLGRAYKRLNRTREAQEAFKKAQELIQSDVESLQKALTVDSSTLEQNGKKHP